MNIRPATPADHDAIWAILEPTTRAGDTFALPPDMSREDAMAYWLSPGHSLFVAEEGGVVLGSYYIRANQKGGGAHVANCGYMTLPQARGRGIARALCAHSIDVAIAQGYRAMQFNFVVSTNERAVAIWRDFGFEVVGRLPGAFRHPALGFVDALVMFKPLAAG
jgi:ribosomal protein S18 acetylase RimI-like enzyme